MTEEKGSSDGRDFGKDLMKCKKDMIKSMVFEAADAAAGFFFPRRCPLCDCVVEPGKLICGVCNQKNWRIREPVCKRCGKPVENDRREYCRDCQVKSHKYRQGKAVFLYRGEIQRSMYRFKYNNKREYAVFYANEAADLYGHWIKQHNIEAIVPVPMFSGKKRLRGYNQAGVFAAALGRTVGLPVDQRLIMRVRNTVPQKELNDRERKSNLKNAFQLKPDIVKYNQILLVDDIYTTGSTIDAVAEVLLSAGIKDIYYICISIGEGF